MAFSKGLAILPLVFAPAAAQQPTKLRITNGCKSAPMWIAHMAQAAVGPDPENIMLKPLANFDFTVPAGLMGTRYWAKMGCDKDGNQCNVGESGGPGETCSTKYGCAPPVDTKFEGSFGVDGADWVDISLVDGWTLPFKFEMFLAKGKKCGGGGKVATTLDCSKLSWASCPTKEDLGVAGKSMSLDVQNPSINKTVGCYSPCAKLTYRNWNNKAAAGRMPNDPDVKDFCCPTPPETVKGCRTGPVEKTQYVKTVHKECPGVYGYAYDDGVGLLRCPDDTKYHVTFFCPPTSEEVWMPRESGNEILVGADDIAVSAEKFEEMPSVASAEKDQEALSREDEGEVMEAQEDLVMVV